MENKRDRKEIEESENIQIKKQSETMNNDKIQRTTKKDNNENDAQIMIRQFITIDPEHSPLSLLVKFVGTCRRCIFKKSFNFIKLFEHLFDFLLTVTSAKKLIAS